MSRTIEMTLEEVISGEMSDQIRHIGDKIIKVDTGEIIETEIMREVGVD